ncbi:hypothetical protein QCA50_000776 [Cerrena zonata]|uniref:BTB domain-containing protein n=1 Tax=Cerrena zonata TaxID=2478898 RepID=A0AAW0GU83_9APHY
MISISPLFNSPNADLVLRSTPSLHSPQPVDFLVHRCALSVASPFFDTMFSLPQAPNDAKDTRPVIDVSEAAETLEGLLRLIYPMTSPTIKSREQLVLLLDAASKYDVPVALESLSRLLTEPQYMSDPVWVYATASRLDLEEAAKLASRHTLGIDICDCSSREDLAIYDYNRLHDLHQRRSQAALALLQIPDDIKCTLCNLGPITVFFWNRNGGGISSGGQERSYGCDQHQT